LSKIIKQPKRQMKKIKLL